jgi:autotransporter-associated beta strand protein
VANIPRAGFADLSLPIGGPGGVTQNGFGSLGLSGDNSYAGQTLVHSGSIRAESNHALGSTSAATIVDFVASLDFMGSLQIDEPITIGGASGLTTGINVLSGDVILNAPITLSTDAGGRFAVVANGSLTINANVTGTQFSVLSLYGNPIRFAATSTVDVDILSQYEGTTLFNGTTPRGRIFFSSLPPFPAGIFGGTGTVGLVAADYNAVLSPGNNGVGTLSTGDLFATNGFINLDLSAAGSDQLAVHGAVNLHSYPEAPGATLRFTVATGFTPPAGATYRIVDNDGTDPVIGTFQNLPQGAVAVTVNGVPLFINYHGGDGNDIELSTTQVAPAPAAMFAVGAGAGGLPLVNVYGRSGNLIRSFLAYDAAFRGGVHVATADITADGVPDIVTAPASNGGPVIRLWNGATGAMIREFLAYDPAFQGGVFVAVGDVDGDGGPDIITGAGPGGGPHVKVFSGAIDFGFAGSLIRSFFAYDPNFRGGVSVAAGDANHDGHDDIITGAGPGGGPHVRVFDGVTTANTVNFFAYDAAFRGGVNVATLPDVIGNLGIVTAPGQGGGPDIRVFIPNGVNSDVDRFLAYDASFFGGVNVAVAPIGPNGESAIITGAGPGGGPHVKAFLPTHTSPPQQLLSFFAFDPAFMGGVYVG